MNLIFSASKIQFDFAGQKSNAFLSLKDIQIFEEDRVLLIGQSGSGKTTLLRLIEGSLQSNDSIIEKKARAALIYQDFRLIEERSVLENVLSGALAELKSFDIGFSKNHFESAHQFIEELGLKIFIHQKVKNLSGGQKQRVAMARALMSRPKLLLADECFNQLDKENTEHIFNLILTLQKKYKFALILSQHDGKIPVELFNQKIDLPSKSSVVVNKNKFPTGYFSFLILLGLVSFYFISFQGFTTHEFFSSALKTLFSFIPKNFNQIASMDWQTIFQTLLETFGMAFGGTLFGMLLSFPLALFCSHNLFPSVVFRPLRFLMTLIRTVPAIIWALVFVAAAGLGTVSGIAALAVYTTGYLTKLIYEGLENIDQTSYWALRQLGASRFQSYWYAIKPNSYSVLVSNSIFMLEYNFRGASLLGLVGAGGLGQSLMYYIEWRQFEKAGVLILIMFFCVMILDFISERIRKALTN